MARLRLLALISLLVTLSAFGQQNNGSTTMTVNPLVIKVVGNHFEDGAGHKIQLVGMNLPLTADCPNSNFGSFSPALIETWNANVVRLAMDEECWLGINGETGQPQSAITNLVTQFHRNGMYVILDLHYSAPSTLTATYGQPLPNRDHSSSFWTSVATAFKNDQAVIFNIFNEPGAGQTNPGWSCWLNGGCTVQSRNGPVVSYTAAGMQELVNAVRNAGATTQPILLDGLAGATDFSQFLANLPTDPSNAIAADFHNYDVYGCDTGCIAGTINPLLSANVPVIIGELGEFDCLHSYIDGIMSFADGYSPPLGYVGWAWNTGGCTIVPSLISDYNGTPTAFGIGLKNHLGAIR